MCRCQYMVWCVVFHVSFDISKFESVVLQFIVPRHFRKFRFQFSQGLSSINCWSIYFANAVFEFDRDLHFRYGFAGRVPRG